jgi:hypothetical protein
MHSTRFIVIGFCFETDDMTKDCLPILDLRIADKEAVREISGYDRNL